MSFDVKVIADSISELGPRITTLQLKFPRFILPEFNTHRAFSRNASSSRAIPVKTMIERISNDPAQPIHWGSNKPGMQAGEELTGWDQANARCAWIDACTSAIQHAEELNRIGLHKQIVNRVLEPFMHIDVVVTATEWENFFKLRCHKDAQPEFQHLARLIEGAMSESKPLEITSDQWHLPYVRTDKDLLGGLVLKDAIKASVARCARVSYLNHDGSKPDLEADKKLYQRLIVAKPPHASPAEHQATPDVLDKDNWFCWGGRTRYANEQWHGNFVGWCQWRKMIGG